MSDVQVLRAIVIPRPIPVLLSVVAGYVDELHLSRAVWRVRGASDGKFRLAGTLFIKSSRARLQDYSPFRFSSSQAWL